MRSLRLVLIPIFAALVLTISPYGLSDADATPPELCQTGTVKNMKAVIFREHNYFDGVIGDANAKNLLPCNSPVTNFWSFPAVLPANLQGPNINSISQVGYLRCGKKISLGGCGTDGSVPNDGNIHFVYTQNDDCGGCYVSADGWFGAAPILNHRYRFKITLTTQPNRWTYCIRDITANGAYVCRTEIAHYINADTAWWGSEVGITSAGMGPWWSPVDNRIAMYWMQYNWWNDTTWYVTTNNDVVTEGAPLPLVYKCYQYSVNYTNDAIETYTLASSSTVQCS